MNSTQGRPSANRLAHSGARRQAPTDGASGFAAIEVDSEGRNYTIVARHGLGEVWSRFVKEWLDQFMVSIGITPKVEVAEDSVIVRFTRN